MEVYIGPRQEHADAVLHREQVLAALAQVGLAVARAEEKPGADGLRARWILSFDGTEVSVQFQETEDGLVFATLEQSMFDDSSVPDRVCRVLEALGWEVDEENVG